MREIGLTLFILGVGGIGGAIELDTNIAIPLAMVAAALIILKLTEVYEKENNTSSNNDSSYPSFLERIRRGA